MEIVSTGNDEIDRHLGGGIPLPIMMLLEGDNGTGKSVFAAQMIKGFLQKGMRVLLFTDNNVTNYLSKMKIITYDFSNHFFSGQLRIIPMHAFGNTWSKEQSPELLPILGKFLAAHTQKYDVVVLDPLSLLALYSDVNSLLNFFTKCKHYVSNGTSMIMTLHNDVIPRDVSLQIKSTCDIYIQLSLKKIGGKEYKVFNSIKFAGATSAIESNFSFDIDTQFGIKIIPISMAQG